MMITHYPLGTFEVSAFQQKKAGKDCCGDSYLIKETDEHFICAVADGLGSGRPAHEASQSAVKIIEASLGEPLDVIMTKVNEAQGGLRGVVLSMFRIDLKRKKMQFCGVGNIYLMISTEDGRMIQPLPSQGYMSGRPLKYHVQEFDYPENGWFAIYSDGIRVQSRHLGDLYELFSTADQEDIKAYIQSLMIKKTDDDMTLVMGKIH